MRDFEPRKDPYYMEWIDSDTSEYDSLYDTLSKHYKSLKLESTFKDKQEELLDYLEEEFGTNLNCKIRPNDLYSNCIPITKVLVNSTFEKIRPYNDSKFAIYSSSSR